MMPALGDSSYFIAALKDLVLRAIGLEPTSPAIAPSPSIPAAATRASSGSSG
jgi:hypothetical protein